MPDIVSGPDYVDVTTPEVTITFFDIGATALFKINNTNVTSSILSAKITRTNGYQCATAEIYVPTGNVSGLAAKQRVEYWSKLLDGTAYKEFDGYIDTFTPNGSKTRIFAYDKIHKAIELNATNKTYDAVIDTQAGVISAIFKDLLDQAGLTYNSGNTTIQSTATYGLPALDKFVANENDIFELLVRLATVANWQFYFNANDGNVYFEPKGFRMASMPLVVGTNIVSVPQWSKNITEMVNVLTVKGAVAQIYPAPEIFSGDGSTKIFNLAQTPSSFLQVQTPINTVKIGGVPNSTIGFDYYLNDFVTMDGTHVPQIVFTSAPASASNNIQVAYSYDVPTPVVINGPDSSRSIYGDFQKTITLTDTLTVLDAYRFGNQIVTAFSQPFLTANFNYNDQSAAYYVGQTVAVTDSINAFTNQTLVINQQIISYPSPIDEITAGNKDWFISDMDVTTQQRLSKIEADLSGQSAGTYVAQGAGAGFTMARKTLVVETRSINSWFIYDIDRNYDADYLYDDQSTIDSTTTYNY